MLIKVATLYHQLQNDPLPHCFHNGDLYQFISIPKLLALLTTHTFMECGLVALLREEITCETLLTILVPGQLQVHDGPALIAGYPDGAEAGDLGETVGEMRELVSCDVEDGEAREGGKGAGEGGQLVVAEGEDGQRRALTNLRENTTRS